jgi:hypothetical protein
MNIEVKKILIVAAAIASLTLIVLADEGRYANGQDETGNYNLSQCGGSGGQSCSYESWTHYGCWSGTSGSCTPYDTAHVPHSGNCVYYQGFGWGCE